MDRFREGKWYAQHTLLILDRPTDLAFDPQRGVLYIVDFGNDRLVELVINRKETSTWVDSDENGMHSIPY